MDESRDRKGDTFINTGKERGRDEEREESMGERREREKDKFMNTWKKEGGREEEGENG